MALHTLNDDGTMAWNCGSCRTDVSAHIDHHHVQFVEVDRVPAVPGGKHTLPVLDNSVIALPPCPFCSARTFLKATFTQSELDAPNMKDEHGKRSDSHATALRHLELSRRMTLLPSKNPPQ